MAETVDAPFGIRSLGYPPSIREGEARVSAKGKGAVREKICPMGEEPNVIELVAFDPNSLKKTGVARVDLHLFSNIYMHAK